MRISHDYKFVFLSLPRSASLSVRKVLEPYSDVTSTDLSGLNEDNPFWHHIRAEELRAIFEERGWKWNEYRIFCCVRNPFSRVVSAYKYHREELSGWVNTGDWKEDLKSFVYNKLVGKPSFPEYVRNIDPEAEGLVISLESFITSQEGDVLVDDVLKVEEMPDNLVRYLRKMGINIGSEEVPHYHASRDRRPYKKWYNRETAEMVRRQYEYEIEKFGYSL